MNIDKLKGKLVENRLSIEQLATRMDCHPSTLYRKFEQPQKITIGDASEIRKHVPMTNEEAYEIFLT